jgi:cell division protein FtsQ
VEVAETLAGLQPYTDAGDSSAALLGLSGMKLKLKRGPAAETREDAAEFTRDTVPTRVRRNVPASSPFAGTPLEASAFAASQFKSGVQPAPAGALHRAYVGGYAPSAEAEDDLQASDDAEHAAQRAGQRRWLNVPVGVVKSAWLTGTWGRVAVGAVIFFLLGATGATLFVTRSWLLHDERFTIASSESIQIDGIDRLTRDQVLSVFGADVERNIWKVPLAERRADLERLPWVQHATVMRLLPDRLRVAITERTPVAFVRNGTNIGLVDASGVLLDMPPDAAGDLHYTFPVLTGLAPSDPLSTRAARMEIYRRFLADIDSGGDKLSEKVSEVDVSNPEDVKAMIAGNGSDVLVHFGDEQFLSRFQHFEQHLDEWRQQYPKLSAADMRYDRQVVLEMQPASAITPAATAEASVSSPAAAATMPVVAPVSTTAAARGKAAPGPAKSAAAKSVAAKSVSAKSAAIGPAATGTATTGPAATGPAPLRPATAANGSPHAAVKPAGHSAAGASAANAKIFKELAAQHAADTAKQKQASSAVKPAAVPGAGQGTR